MPYLEQMVKGVKAMGLESCMTLGTLTDSQAQRLAGAGLDYYNHNLDTSPEFYGNIITTRTYQERLDTLGKVRGRELRCAPVASSGWAKRKKIVPDCCCSWPTCRHRRKACPSTCW
ncbi:Biotin synthase [Raoultella terrigena]|uniref:Biotin synthase n=1 Tax=Raoultella terrigena TaxID=577 RepID=A0A4U9DAI9_RAOTE|nr:Biotin synthase [Raoultella terrigena]